MWTRAVLSTSILLGMHSSGCTQMSCNDIYVYPNFRISVADAVSGLPICDAIVTVGGATARISQTDCSYVYEIPQHGEKTATIAATRDGYDATSKEVSTAYDKDDCGHAISKPVKLTLEPK
jgi:hypothetical protein